MKGVQFFLGEVLYIHQPVTGLDDYAAISSLSFNWTACRIFVLAFLYQKTIKNVMMVVLVLITSRQCI